MSSLYVDLFSSYKKKWFFFLEVVLQKTDNSYFYEALYLIRINKRRNSVGFHKMAIGLCWNITHTINNLYKSSLQQVLWCLYYSTNVIMSCYYLLNV